jgi:hypothetical protein
MAIFMGKTDDNPLAFGLKWGQEMGYLPQVSSILETDDKPLDFRLRSIGRYLQPKWFKQNVCEKGHFSG